MGWIAVAFLAGVLAGWIGLGLATAAKRADEEAEREWAEMMLRREG